MGGTVSAPEISAGLTAQQGTSWQLDDLLQPGATRGDFDLALARGLGDGTRGLDALGGDVAAFAAALGYDAALGAADVVSARAAADRAALAARRAGPVSYTHLTLPTILLV